MPVWRCTSCNANGVSRVHRKTCPICRRKTIYNYKPGRGPMKKRKEYKKWWRKK